MAVLSFLCFLLTSRWAGLFRKEAVLRFGPLRLCTVRVPLVDPEKSGVGCVVEGSIGRSRPRHSITPLIIGQFARVPRETSLKALQRHGALLSLAALFGLCTKIRNQVHDRFGTEKNEYL